MHNRKSRIIIVLLAAIIVFIGFGYSMMLSKPSPDKPSDIRGMSSANSDQIKNTASTNNVPTLFVHGVGGGFYSEMPMVKQAVKDGTANWGLAIHVTEDNQLKIKGTLKHKKNPIILIRFDNNAAGEVQDAKWLKLVLTKLRNKYHVTNYNIVGHSMGAYAAVYYGMYYAHDDNQPRLNKLVAIAGPFDGILTRKRYRWEGRIPKSLLKLWDDSSNLNHLNDAGRPAIIHPEYRALLRNRGQFPRQAEVLNLYGNVGNGYNSDGTVSNVSSESLGYLLKGRVKRYQDRELTGDDTTHFELHDKNKEVRKILKAYLWQNK